MPRRRPTTTLAQFAAVAAAAALIAGCTGDSAPVITETETGAPAAQGTPLDQVQPWLAGVLRADGSGPAYPTTWPVSLVQGAGSSTSLAPILVVPRDAGVTGSVDVEVVSLSAGGGFGVNGTGPATGVVWSGRAQASGIALPAAQPVLAQGGTYAWRVRSGAGAPWVGPWPFGVDAVRAGSAPVDRHGGVGVNLMNGVPSTSWKSQPLPGAAGAISIGAVFRPGTPATPGLPPNWAWVLPGSGLIQLTESKVTGGSGALAGPLSVKLSSGDGAGPTFVRTASGAYQPGLADGTVTSYSTGGVLTRLAPGVWEFSSPDGGLTRFESGRAVGEWSGGIPLVGFTWDSAGRLVSLTDGVQGGRSMSISYGGESCEASSWAGFAVSEGLWCAVAYPDGTSTQVGYVDGRIGMIVDAGGVGVGLGWDAAGRLARVRGVASTMAAATDAAWRVDATAAVIDYDQYGRVQSVTAPATRPDAARLRHTYTYPTGQSQPLRAQVAEDVVQGGSATLTDTALGRGVVSAVEARSDTWQIIKSTGGDGLVSSMSYNPASGALSSGTAANGRATTMNSDAEGLVSSTVGPFLASPAGALTTARTLDATVLDPTNPTASTTRAWEGLAAVVWGEGAVGGSPQWWNRSILGDGLGASFSGSPLGGTAPWRAQATGLWRIAESGKYRIGINASGRTGVDLTIDGSRCVDDSGAAGCTLPLSKGEHFVTLSISANRPDGSAAFAVTATGQGRSGRIAIADLRPNYNVATRTVTNDIVGGSNLATRVMDFAQPWTGSPSSVTAAGGLTTRIRYEGTNATTGAFGRPLEMTTPGGATQQMTYFGVGESVTDPCTGTSLPQSGQRRSTTRYDRVVEASVYDGAGRVVSTTTTGDGVSEVACFAYDAAGRLIASSITGIDGALREKSSISHTMAGGRLTQTTTITLGDGAPVRAGETFVSVVVMDTAGQVLESTEANGTRTAWEYDVDGSPVRRTVWAPGAQQPTLDVVSVYDSLTGWLSSVEANGTVLARVTYDRYGLPSSIAYASGVQAAVAYDTAGSTKELRLAAGAQQISQTRTRNAAGRTTAVSTTVTGAGQSSYDWRYTYDSAGRLTAAALRASGRSEITGGTARAMEYTYGAAPSGCAAGAAADLERTGGSRDGTTYQTCRDERGRLKWTTDPHLAESGQRAEATYDALGRLTSLSGRVPLTQTWLHGTQVAAITEGSTDADRVTTTLLTVGGVLLERTYADASGSTVTRYGYGGSTTPSLLLDDKGAVTDIRVDLPGGALAHLTPQQSISVEHADLYGAALAVSRDGAFVGDGISSALGPFGEPLGEQAATGPTSGIGTGTAFTFHAGPRNATLAGHHSITLTARPYHPWLGEFLAFDPEVGASTTGYGYGDGNPVDKPDFSGGEGLWDLIGVAGGILAAVGGVATGNINVRTSSLAKVAAGAALAVGTAAAVTGVVMSWKTSDSTASSAFTTAIAAVGLVIAGHAVGSKILSERENNRLLRQYVGQAQGLAEIDAQVADFKRAMEQRRLDLYKPNMNINQMQVAMDSFNQAKEAYEEALLDRTYYHFVSVSNKGPQSFKDWWSGYDLLNTKFVPAG